MIEIKRKVEIRWKYNPSAFDKINNNVLGESLNKIGSGVTAVSKMITGINGEMLRMVMPTILNADAESREVNWDARVKDYWDSLSVSIPSGGKILETGFNFSISDYKRREFIKALDVKTDKELADYVMSSKVEEQERWKYGEPINPSDYLLWRYCFVYRHVANSFLDVNKSPNIRFYLYTPEERDKARKAELKAKNDSLKAYMKFIDKAELDDYNDILSILVPNDIRDIVSNKDIEEKQASLMDIVTSKPDVFVSTVSDKSLKLKATVARLSAFGVIKQLPNSTVYVEAADPSVVIGNNMNEAVTFLSNDKNKVKINELTAKYKSIVN